MGQSDSAGLNNIKMTLVASKRATVILKFLICVRFGGIDFGLKNLSLTFVYRFPLPKQLLKLNVIEAAQLANTDSVSSSEKIRNY